MSVESDEVEGVCAIASLCDEFAGKLTAILHDSVSGVTHDAESFVAFFRRTATEDMMLLASDLIECLIAPNREAGA
jgi:hypothetical protein